MKAKIDLFYNSYNTGWWDVDVRRASKDNVYIDDPLDHGGETHGGGFGKIKLIGRRNSDKSMELFSVYS